ncbi:MAG TPA: cysteine desulfurase family protein [Rhabdochlamydiaceae bacterium]|nr:cysteine desulfurase family protein [Rhabdochlamydiaceae bacterium]
MKRIYLDNNATTALDKRVLEAMLAELEKEPANPSSVHSFGREAKNRLQAARRTIADYLQVKPSELFFFSSGSEALNTLLRSFSRGHIITSDIEHSAVHKTVQLLEKRAVSATYLSTGLWGAVQPEQVRKAIRPETQLIILSAVNSETGVKNPIEEIASIAKEASIPFIVDAVSLLGKEPFKIADGVSAIVFSAHKFHGPKGVGLAWIHPRFKWEPLITGGDQELSKRAGTENLWAIIGCAKAIALLNQELPEAAQRMQQLRDRFENKLQEQLPHVQINGQGPRVVNTSNLSFLGIDGEDLLIKLDLNGLAASHGSACSSGALEPSRVLRNMGLSKEEAGSAIRFSLSRMTTEEEIDQAIDLIVKQIKKQYE